MRPICPDHSRLTQPKGHAAPERPSRGHTQATPNLGRHRKAHRRTTTQHRTSPHHAAPRLVQPPTRVFGRRPPAESLSDSRFPAEPWATRRGGARALVVFRGGRDAHHFIAHLSCGVAPPSPEEHVTWRERLVLHANASSAQRFAFALFASHGALQAQNLHYSIEGSRSCAGTKGAVVWRRLR